MHEHRFPGETDRYRQARDELLRQEIELRRRMEAVAALRRALPTGGEVPQDYEFDADGGAKVKLSELFGDHDTLVLYNFMYGPKAAEPCPMCSSFLDGLEGNAQQIEQRTALAVVARSPIARIREFADRRGWQRLKLYSSASNDFNLDYFGEDEDGEQRTMLHVFTRSGGHVRHFWSTELGFVPSETGQNERHIDTMWPLWNVLDTTPEGRGESWFPKLWY
ncbi:MAG TPA: DUF899 family protein [Nannocystaceae bacterium]|nr:DUF899 family protein [Nannocystaceae bacterium]